MPRGPPPPLAEPDWHGRDCLPRPSPPGDGSRSRHPGEGVLSKYLLRLYVTGKTARAEQAIENLRKICDEELEGRYDVEIIDVLESPELAEEEKILATPTLIKRLPPPLRRVIGDLSQKEKVLLGLEVRTGSEPQPPSDESQ
jgi:circadian clock protein KaiB